MYLRDMKRNVNGMDMEDLKRKADRALQEYDFEGVSEFVKEDDWVFVQDKPFIHLQKKIAYWCEGVERDREMLFSVYFDENREVDEAVDWDLGPVH